MKPTYYGMYLCENIYISICNHKIVRCDPTWRVSRCPANLSPSSTSVSTPIYVCSPKRRNIAFVCFLDTLEPSRPEQAVRTGLFRYKLSWSSSGALTTPHHTPPLCMPPTPSPSCWSPMPASLRQSCCVLHVAQPLTLSLPLPRTVLSSAKYTGV